MRVVLFINLRPGDKVEMELEDGGLVLRRKSGGQFWWRRERPQ
jgi:hypothetical protein